MKKRILAVFLFTLILICQMAPVFSAPALDKSLYYGEAKFYLTGANGPESIDSIVSGDILCTYSVVSGEDDTEFAVLAGLYENDALISLQSMTQTLQSGENRMYSLTVQVPSGSDYSIRLFLVKTLKSRTPVMELARLSTKSRAKDVTEFVLDGIDGIIDNLSNRICVTLPYGAHADGLTPHIEVSDGAKYALSGTDFSAPQTVTVTAADGSERTYTVTVSIEEAIEIDFEDFIVNETPDKVDPKHWRISQSTDTSNAVIAEEDGNRFLAIKDSNDKGALQMYYENISIPGPFEFKCKVKYLLPDGVSVSDATNNLSYLEFRVRDTASGTNYNLCGFQPVQSNGRNNFTFNYFKNGSGTNSNYTLSVGNWYDVTMKYYQGENGAYYSDYTVRDSSGKVVASIPKTESLAATGRVTQFYFFATAARCGYMYLDDISLRSLTGNELYEEDFEGGTAEGWTGGTVSESPAGGKALMLSGGSEASLELDSFNGATKLAFDLRLTKTEGAAELFSFGNNSENVGKLLLAGDKLQYEVNGQSKDLWNTELNPDTTYRLELDFVTDAMWDCNRVDVYLDGICIGNTIPLSDIEYTNRVTFAAPSGGAMYVDNVCIEKR